MIQPWVRYEEIEEKRAGYYVTYSPVFTGHEFAMLNVCIYEAELLDHIKDIAEKELEYWAFKYRTPIMLMISNKTDEHWCTKDKIGHDFLLGYARGDQIVCYWDEYPDSEKPRFDLSKENLAKIYADLSFTTYEEVVKKHKAQAKGRKFLLAILTLWACVIPALIAFLGWSNPVVSLIALAYSWYVALQKGLALWGRKKKSERQIAEEEEQRAREHHHYHCQLNPEGFARLKFENFERERREKDRAKIEDMRV